MTSTWFSKQAGKKIIENLDYKNVTLRMFLFYKFQTKKFFFFKKSRAHLTQVDFTHKLISENDGMDTHKIFTIKLKLILSLLLK